MPLHEIAYNEWGVGSVSNKEAKSIFEPKRPIVPNSWTVKPFLDVVDVVSDKGKRTKQRDYLTEGNIPVIDQGQEFIGGYINDDDMAFDDELPIIVFGDHTRAIKYVNQLFAVGADGVKLLKPSGCFESKFFFYLLKSLQIPSRGYSRHFQFLKKFQLPLPPLNQQTHIVAEIEKQFSRLDEAVANLKRVKANLKRYKAAVLKAAVEGKLTEEWRKQHPDVEPADKLLERILAERREKWQGRGKYKEPVAPDTTDLPELPEGWVWASISQVFEVCIGATPSRGKSEYWNGTIPWVSSGEVAFCRIRSTRETITDLGLKNTSTRLHPPGTVLLGMIGEGKTRGQVAILDIDACNNQNSAAIRVSDADVIPEYVYNFFECEYESTRKRGSGGNQPALNKSRVGQIVFPLPSIAEQCQIVVEVERCLSIVAGVDAQIDSNCHRADRLRQSILKKAFSGKLVSNQ